MKEIKQAFSWYYNQRHNRRDTLWGERFKSVMVESGETLINCLVYIDLNPVRAAIVERPEDDRWSSLGYHIQTGNRDGFLSFDFGLVECAALSLRELSWASLKEFETMDTAERLRSYRRYVYEAGGIKRARRWQARIPVNLLICVYYTTPIPRRCQINLLIINEINVKRRIVWSLRPTFLVKKMVQRNISIITGNYPSNSDRYCSALDHMK